MLLKVHQVGLVVLPSAREGHGPAENWHSDPTMDTDEAPPTRMLTSDAVMWAIAELKGRRTHPFFLPYLQLCRRSAIEQSSSNVTPQWSDLGSLLAVPGGPPERPHYRPLDTKPNRDESHYWINKNLAGMWAPSSIRTTAGFLLDGNQFRLPENHAELALHAFLYDQPVSALALGTYLFRDYGFNGVPGVSRTDLFLRDRGIVLRRHSDAVGRALREWFRLGDETAGVLFSETSPTVEFEWFELPADGDFNG